MRLRGPRLRTSLSCEESGWESARNSGRVSYYHPGQCSCSRSTTNRLGRRTRSNAFPRFNPWQSLARDKRARRHSIHVSCHRTGHRAAPLWLTSGSAHAYALCRTLSWPDSSAPLLRTSSWTSFLRRWGPPALTRVGLESCRTAERLCQQRASLAKDFFFRSSWWSQHWDPCNLPQIASFRGTNRWWYSRIRAGHAKGT